MTLKKRKDKLLCVGILFLLSAFSVFICMQAELAIFSRGISGRDSSVFRYIAYLMRKGYVPYRDTFDHKGPILYFINYIGMMIHPVRGIWLFEVTALFGAIIFSYKTARLFASRVASLLSVVTAYALLADCFRGGNVTQEYAIPFIAMSLYFFVYFLYLNKINNVPIFLCGVGFAIVCLLQLNLIVVWIVGIPIIFFWNIYKKQWLELSREIALFSLGVAVIVIPVFLYFILNHAFFAFWDNYIVFNFSYSSVQSVRDRLDCYQLFIAQPLVYLAVAGLVYEIYLLKQKSELRQISKRLMLIIACSFFLTFPLICVSGKQGMHYEIILVPVLVMPICFFYTSLLDNRTKEDKISFVRCFVLFWIIAELIMPSMIKIWNRGLDENRYLTKIKKDEWLEEIKEAVETYSDIGDTISVFGNKDIIYLLCDRMSASKYSFQFPIVQIRRNIYQEYLSDLERKMPKVIIIESEYAEEYEEIFKEWLEENNYRTIDERETIFVREKVGI